MVRWRVSLLLALVLLLPARLLAKHSDDEDDEERSEESEEEEDDEDEEEEEESSPADKQDPVNRRAQNGSPPTLSSRPVPGMGIGMTKTPKRRPLECYVCAYKSETPLRACLDPTKFRVHTITCHSVDDKCFTSVLSKGEQYEAVVRGCRSGCVGSPETTCCDLNRCNNQAFAMPMIQPRVAKNIQRSKSSKIEPPNIFYFVTILLILQTTSKVSIV